MARPRSWLILTLTLIWPLARASAMAISSDTLSVNGHLVAGYSIDESQNVSDQFEIERLYFSSQYKATHQLIFYVSALLNKLDDPQEGLEFAYAKFKSSLGEFQAGQFSLPLTQEATLLPVDLNLAHRSQSVSQLFDNEPNGADLGIQWKLHRKKWNSAFALANGSGANANYNPGRKTLVGRLGYSRRDFEIAGYGYNGIENTPTGQLTKNRWGAELLMGQPGQGIKAEYHRGQDESRHSRGWFIEADLILGIFSPEAYRKWDWLQKIRPMLRVESYDPDIHTLLNRETTTSLALHLLPHPQWRLTIQQDWNREEDPNQQLTNDLLSFQAQIRL